MTAQPIDDELVRSVAQLARLGLEPAELGGLGRQLAGLLAHFEALQDVETRGVEPLVHPLDTRGAAAPDEVLCAIDPRAELLPRTAHAREGFFVVPRVLDADFGPDAGAGPSGG